MTKFDRIESARIARAGTDPFSAPRVAEAQSPRKIASFRRTDFAVGKLYDAGQFVPLYLGMTRDTAEALSGRLRDQMTEGEVKNAVEEGWNYQYQMTRGNLAKGMKHLAFIPSQARGKIKDAMGEKAKPGFAGMTPERRREISVKANAARRALLSPERRSAIARTARAAR